MAMDVKRDPAILRRKKIRQGIIAVLGVIGVIAISVVVSRLEPAAPGVEETTLWFDTVKRGDITREVKGAGTLVPEDIRWIPATAPGRVERIILRPGAQVQVGTPIIELDNPDLVQQRNDAELSWKAAQAQLESQEATQQTNLLQSENAVANAQSSYDLAQKNLDANRQLAAKGIVSELNIQQLEAQLAQAKNTLELSRRQLEAAKSTQQAQLAPLQATVSQRKADFDRLTRQVSELTVRSTMNGQLQVVNVEVGAQVGVGTNIVRVSDPTHLKAEVRISETQTKDLAIGLSAMIDTRNGIVPGHVSRIDPASQNGTVGVDVTLDGPLPPGARPDLSVDGTVQLEQLNNILYVQSPAYGSENSTISLFKVDPTTNMAARTQVKIGRRSVQYVEVVDGLKEGDKVVLSDMSQYDAFDRIQINR
ncbi:MAG: HlyD family efflux transporter periplasmic adaptor subunit [Vicinamibacterales bacterium]